MNFLYNAAIRLYGLGIKLAGIRSPKARLLAEGEKNVWKLLDEKIVEGESYIWIHASSLGEFEQGRPLMELLREKHPEYKILLTFFSPSGYEVRKNFSGADAICYLPLDTPANVRRFLDKVNPQMAIFVKYEFWRNYLFELRAREIPTYLISGIFRPDQLFFKPWGRFYASWLKCFNGLYLQDERSRRLLAGIGIRNTEVCGDTRFDRVSAIRATRKPIPLLERFADRTPEQEEERTADAPTVMMAGSSWPEDEEVYAEWFNRHPEVKLVIAPHEFDSQRLKKLSSRFSNGTVLMSEAEKNPSLLDGKQVLIIDCFGMLSSAYAYCDVAYVGGGFGAGLHNINEAAVYDVPVIYGPNNAKFIEAAEMARSGGGIPIASRQDFEKFADGNFHDISRLAALGMKAGEYIRSKLGATLKIYNSLFKKN